MSRPEISFERIELIYFKEEPIKDVLIKDIKPITSIKRKSEEKNIKIAKLEKVEIDLKKKPESKIEQKIDATKDAISEISKDSRNERTATIESGSEDGAVREGYYLKVREKIKSLLEKNRRRFTKEGEVYVRFIIDRNGALKDLMLYKSSGKDTSPLETIAIESIKQASPFPPFSDGMDENKLLFKLPIRFTSHP